jgi:hypothetical protein
MRIRLALPLIALLSSSALNPAFPQTFSLTPPAPTPSEKADPATPTTASAIVAEPEIRRVAMAGDGGFLQGESAAREWPLFVKPSEVGRAKAIQIAFAASVSDSPNLSHLHVFLNDRAIGDIEIKGGEQGAIRKLEIDPSLLSPGLNSVRVDFESVHRVDCSPVAAYELWARMDPSATGLVLAAPQTPPSATLRDVSDLFTVHASSEGVTPIYVRSPSAPDSKSAERLIRVVDALARNLRLTNPAVTLGAPPKGDAGIEVAIATREQLSQDHVDLNRDRISVTADDARPLVLLTGADEVAVDQQATGLVAELDRLALSGSSAGIRAATRVSGRAIDGDTTVKLGELGLAGGAGHGRRWDRSINISLPQNFVASVYEQATLRLKGAAPGGLLPGSDLHVSVNGVGAASLGLAGDAPVDFEGQTLTLPFTLFHPGVNRLTFEAVTVAAEDALCDVGSHRQRPLVQLSPETTLSFPHFTRLQVGPEVSRMLAVRSAAGTDRLHAALLRPDADSLGAAMTMFANLAVQGRQADIDMTYGRPTTFDQSGMIFGATADVPRELSRTFSGLYVQASEPSYTTDDADASASAPSLQETKPMTTAEGAGGRSFWFRIIRDLRWIGFAFDEPGARHKLIVRPGDLIIADAPTTGWGVIRAGVAIPTIATAPKSWMVVASDTNEQLARGMTALAANGEWDGFSGQASVFEPSTKRVASLSQGHMFYTLPADWTLADLRDALAIVFSDHVTAYIGVLILLTAMLSAVTVGLLNQRKAEP